MARKRERERNMDLLFPLLMHSLVASRMCPDWGLNLQPGISGQCSNQLSQLARAVFKRFISLYFL